MNPEPPGGPALTAAGNGPAPSGLVQRLVRRAGWSFLDQAAWSLTNFLMSLVVLRSVGLTDFGAFTVAFTTYQVAVRILRALVCEPLAIRYSAAGHEEWRRSSARAVGAALVIGAAGGLVIGFAAAALRGAAGAALVPVAVALPGLMMQDAWRYVFFAGAVPAKAFVNDVIWGGVLLVLVVAELATGTATVTALLAAWAGAGAAAGLVGIVQAGFGPTLSGVSGWLAGHRDLGGRFLAEVALIGSAGPIALYAIGSIAGLDAVGSLNAAVVLLGPISFVAVFVEILGIPEGVRVVRRDPGLLARLVRSSGPALFAAAIVFGLALLAVPDRLGRAVFPDTWAGARAFIPLATLLLAASLWGQAGRVGLRVLAAARRSLTAQAVIAPLIVLGSIVGAVVAGGKGAATGWAAANCVGIVVWLRQFEQAHREWSGGPAA